MDIADSMNLDCKEAKFKGKPLFVSLNHNAALLCWEKLPRADVITFDSHRDFQGNNQKNLRAQNDNFIDIAFDKGIVKNVYWYYLKPFADTQSNSKRFVPNSIKDFEQPKDKFILDIDLDFFVDTNKGEILPESKKYIPLIKGLAESDSCIGITIAMEPTYCGSVETCLKVCKLLGFLGLEKVSREFLI